MAAPVNQIKVGQVEMARWQGSYEGKPTTSFSLKKKKFNKDTKKYEESPFLSITDLSNIMTACMAMLMEYYNNPPAATDSNDVPF